MEFTLRLGEQLLHAVTAEMMPFAIGEDVSIDLPRDAERST
jgi:hypothetical protein